MRSNGEILNTPPGNVPSPHGIAANERYALRWLDDAHTILLLEMFGHWQWGDAAEAVRLQNRVLWAQTVPTDAIILLHGSIGFIPDGSFFRNLRSIFEEPTMERWVIIAGRFHIVKTFLELVGKLYGLRGIEMRYKYAETLDDALRLVAIRRRDEANQDDDHTDDAAPGVSATAGA